MTKLLDELLPGTPRHDKLSRYTRFYLTDPLEVEVELVLAAGEARPIRLGDPNARLGLNTWCFSGDSLGEVNAMFRMAAVPGDLYLFGSVLERFLGGYVTRNCCVRLMVEEIEKGYRFEWPARFGDRFLMYL